MIDRLDETVVALSSAPGHSVVGIVRLTGSRAWDIVERMTSLPGGGRLSELGGFRRVWAEVHIEADASLPAALYVFRRPRSYTREDLVEIQSVGSPAALELIRRRAIELGAIEARPGEFTARAFFNGAMNLAEAEAVAQLIQAQTDSQLRAARRLMDGAFSRRVEAWRVTLAELAALVEADIDFSEEPIDFITPDDACIRLRAIETGLSDLLADSVSSERLSALPRILLIGPPNAGKSSLMNRLACTSRSICAAAAGTTRDILSAPVRVGRCDAILLDSAGVDESMDEVIAAARAMTVHEAQRVELLCAVVDVTRPLEEQAAVVRDALGGVNATPTIVVANKVDLIADERIGGIASALAGERLGPVCPVSAVTGWGMERLESMLAEKIGLVTITATGEAVALNSRQKNGLISAREAIQRAQSVALTSTQTIDGAELLAFEIREALDHLGALGGGVVTEDLLDLVFANFCIGK